MIFERIWLIIKKQPMLYYDTFLNTLLFFSKPLFIAQHKTCKGCCLEAITN